MNTPYSRPLVSRRSALTAAARGGGRRPPPRRGGRGAGRAGGVGGGCLSLRAGHTAFSFLVTTRRTAGSWAGCWG